MTKMSRVRPVTLAAQILLLAYFELCVLLPMGAWNDQPGMHAGFSLGMLILPLAIGFGQLLLLFGSIREIRTLLWIGLSADILWLASHVVGLWVPYIRGATPQYAAMYERVFSRTTKLLPNYGNHIAPDAMHIVLDVLLLSTIVTVAWQLRMLHAAATRRTN